MFATFHRYVGYRYNCLADQEKQKFNPEVNTTLQIIMKHDVVAQKDFKGYKKSNIRSIEIINQKN